MRLSLFLFPFYGNPGTHPHHAVALTRSLTSALSKHKLPRDIPKIQLYIQTIILFVPIRRTAKIISVCVLVDLSSSILRGRFMDHFPNDHLDGHNEWFFFSFNFFTK